MSLTMQRNGLEKPSQIRKNCFLCTTPYQVITCISILQQSNDNCENDIYIINQFADSEHVVEVLKESNLFHHVFHIDEQKYYGWFRKYNNKYIGYAGLLISYISLDKIVADILKGELYDRIYVSTKAITGRLICMYFAKENIHAEYIYYDDGLGSYYNKWAYELTWFDRLCRTLFLGKRTIAIDYKYNLYNPDLYSDIRGKNISAKKISPLKHTDANLKLINKMFFPKGDVNISEKYIILDTIWGETYSNDKQQIVKYLYANINSLLADEVITKAHPRNDHITEGKQLISNGVPFEAICYKNDCSNKVLITDMSSAVFTPKMLFDQEPIIIFLYRVLHDNIDSEIEDFNILCEKFAKTYSNPNKIIIPNREDEVYHSLQSLKETSYE